ncbi:DUF5689 domain-containing protein [Ferruginibacter sp. SUN002]|uniref:DUF5689 domain-containing protein n=1 Tax=Ferruginibacter sp. SUN002 TaxID=2937789 RepID=UPI003D3602EC
MNKFFKLSTTVLSVILVATILNSCKKKFDEPPAATDPAIAVTHTIKDFKAKHTVAGAYDLISEDIVISGVVISSDKSGNIYKQIYIQDETGAIAINVDVPSIGTSFPLGRKVFVKCKGLTLSDNNKQIQLGMKYILNGVVGLEGIPNSLVSQYLFGGTLNNPVVAHLVTPAQLGGATVNMQDRYIGDLVQLENYEFVNADKNKTYSDTSAYKSTVNLNVRNCSGASSNLIIRTSAYSNFAGVNVPDGNGTITALYTVFGNTKQMIIRDTSDVQFAGIRCDGSIPGTEPTLITIAALRAMFTGTAVDISSNRITGVVISDSKNIGAGNIVIQQGTSGIDLFFGTSAASALSAFKVGDSIVVDISGSSLESYNGMLEVVLSSGAVPLSAAGTGKVVTPVKRTIADVIANMASIENTLVTIDNATATSGTFSGNKTLTDASGTMIIRTLSTADFAGTSLPATCQNWTGYVSRFNADNQIYIRTLADMTAGLSCPVAPPTTGLAITTSPFLLNFDAIGTGLPSGVSVRTASTATALGATGTYQPSNATGIWTKTASAFKNFASASNAGFTATTDSATQADATNRALGLRQVSATDKEVAFVFQLDNTTGKTNFAIEFLLQSLDPSVGRTVTWSVDYGIGDAPTTFTPITTSGTMTTGPVFTNNTITGSFGTALDNKASKIWIRIVALGASTGSGNRPSSAVDNFKLTWN